MEPRSARLPSWCSILLVMLCLGCGDDQTPAPDLGDDQTPASDLAVPPDMAPSCGVCPQCKAGEICCGKGGQCDFAPRCLRTCTTTNDCAGLDGATCVQLLSDSCAGGPNVRVCLAGLALCPGISAQPGSMCPVCDVFLNGNRSVCDGTDAKTTPVQINELRVCGFRHDSCPSCMPGLLDGGVTCQK